MTTPPWLEPVLALAEREIVGVANGGTVANIEGGVASVGAAIADVLRRSRTAAELRAHVVDGVAPGVAEQHRKAAAQALVHRELEGVVVAEAVGDGVGDVRPGRAERRRTAGAGCTAPGPGTGWLRSNVVSRAGVPGCRRRRP